MDYGALPLFERPEAWPIAHTPSAPSESPDCLRRSGAARFQGPLKSILPTCSIRARPARAVGSFFLCLHQQGRREMPRREEMK